jgi:elongation factor P
MAMITTSEFKNGMKIEIDGVPYEILEHQHHKPGKGGA